MPNVSNTEEWIQYKRKVNNTKVKGKYRLFSNRDKAQKSFKDSYDWMGKLIHWELCKQFEFHHTNKC